MNNLVKKEQQNGKVVSLRDAAFFERREIFKILSVSKNLTSIEKKIFEASTWMPIGKMDKVIFQKTFLLLLKFIKDVLQVKQDIVNVSEIIDFLLDYYPELSTRDLKTAVLLNENGYLDEHLPRDKFGFPDRSCYNSIDLKFFSKILTAYKKKRLETLKKVYTNYENLEKKDQNKPDFYDLEQKTKQKISFIFDFYKKKNILKIDTSLDITLIYNWLQNIGVIKNEDIDIDNEELRKEAFKDYIKNVNNCVINKYDAFAVKKDGFRSPLLDFHVSNIYKKKKIIFIFDKFINDGIDIVDYFKN